MVLILFFTGWNVVREYFDSIGITFDEIEGLNGVYDWKRYLVLFGPEKYDAIYNRLGYLISLKVFITDVSSHNYGKMKIDFYDSLPIGKTLILHNVQMLIKSVFNKDQNHYYCNLFWEKCSYQIAQKQL